MRIMMQMMENSGQAVSSQSMEQIAQEQTLELNTAHPLVVNLNTLRKKNKVAASLAVRQLLDNVMVASGIPYNVHEGTDRQYKMINSYLELALTIEGDGPQTTDKQTDKKESALNQAQKIKSKSDEKVVAGERIITDSDLKH